MDAATILLVEPHGPTRIEIHTELTTAGLNVLQDAGSDIAGIVRFKSTVSALVVGPSLEHTHQIHAIRLFRAVSLAPIVAISTSDEEADELRLLSAGATEFFTLPLRSAVFKARLLGWIRDFEQHLRPKVRNFGNIHLRIDERTVEVDGTSIDLTKTEFEILAVMSESPYRVFSRRELAEAIWDDEWGNDDHRLEAHMSRLRKKLNEHGGGLHLTAIRGIGYQLLARPQSASATDVHTG